MPYTAKYIGQSLSALVSDTVQQATRQAARNIAETGRDILYDEARAATPSRTGRTRDAWLAHEIEDHGDRLETRVSNSNPRAVWLQYGTEAHEIKPKNKRALSEPSGPRESADVSGIAAHHMTERAGLIAETTIRERSVPALEKWRLEVEQAIEVAKKR